MLYRFSRIRIPILLCISLIVVVTSTSYLSLLLIRSRGFRRITLPQPLTPQDKPRPVGMRWYVTTNSDTYAPYIAAALRSAQLHSDVTPRVLLNPRFSVPRTRAFAQRAGAAVVEHATRYDEGIAEGCATWLPADKDAAPVAISTFIRLDAPLVAAAETLGQNLSWLLLHLDEAADAMAGRPLHENLVLYTDADVLFSPGALLMEDLSSGALAVPPLFAASSEQSVEDYVHFNTGVLLMNVSGMLRSYADLWGFMSAERFKCLAEGPWDQGCLQLYAKARKLHASGALRLAPQWNWRPYLEWPVDTVPEGDRVRLLHFHGPKPWDIATGVLPQLLWGEAPALVGSYRELYERNPPGYALALAEWLGAAAILASSTTAGNL